MLIFIKFFIISFFLLGLFSVQAVFAGSEEDYLKQLEMEADDELPEPSFLEPLSSDNPGSSSSNPDAPSTDVELILDKKELIVDVTSFEKALKGTYPESYELYEQLTDEQKKSIYQDFTRKKRLYGSSVKVISVYLSSH
jgi:hypothetical protein